MNNKNLIIGGVVVACLVAYYFYNKNKSVVAPSSAPSSAPVNLLIPSEVLNNTNSKIKYRVVKPINFGSGFIKGGKGNMVPVNSLAPKVNSIIELDKSPKERYIFNSYNKGFDYEINDSKFFIPYDSVISIAFEPTKVNSNMPSPIFKGGSPAVGTSSVFDCEKAKVEYKQIYEGVKRMMENFTHFSEKQKNDSICSEMRNAIRTKDLRYSLMK